ncbi:MAG: sulfotransferase family protein [Luteimonas sp.]
MDTRLRNMTLQPPVAIGGVGGSGTRLIAELVRNSGVFMGRDLNESCDLLWFTLLFKRNGTHDLGDEDFNRLADILAAGLVGGSPLDACSREQTLLLGSEARPKHPQEEMRAVADTLLAATELPAHGLRWGWKEPNTHVFIDRLWQRLPELRYVHVVRHGIDMAFSSNQNQLAIWGARTLGDEAPSSPTRSLKYWCNVHRRMQDLLASNPDRMYWLDYDAFCRDPQDGFERLRRFLELTDAPSPDLSSVRSPGEARHASQDLAIFPQEDLDYVKALGYPVFRRDERITCDGVD